MEKRQWQVGNEKREVRKENGKKKKWQKENENRNENKNDQVEILGNGRRVGEESIPVAE